MKYIGFQRRIQNPLKYLRWIVFLYFSYLNGSWMRPWVSHFSQFFSHFRNKESNLWSIQQTITVGLQRKNAFWQKNYQVSYSYNPFSANPTKWSNALKQFVGLCPQIAWVFLTFCRVGQSNTKPCFYAGAI